MESSTETKHTVANLLTSPLYASLKLVKGIKHCQDLDSADSVQHVGVMAGSGTEAPAVVQAREDKF